MANFKITGKNRIPEIIIENIGQDDSKTSNKSVEKNIEIVKEQNDSKFEDVSLDIDLDISKLTLGPDKKTGLQRNIGETDEEFELRNVFRNYLLSLSAAETAIISAKEIGKTEWSMSNVEKKVEEKLLNHDMAGAKKIIEEFAQKTGEQGRKLAITAGIIVGGVATGGAGLLVGGSIAAGTTIALEVSGNKSKEQLKQAVTDGVKSGTTTIVAGGAAQLISGAGTVATTSAGKIIQGTAKVREQVVPLASHHLWLMMV